MHIGELAKLTGKSVAALRYYEQVGLLPAAPRNESGYRDYSPETVERVRFIVHAQERGFSLRQIKNVLSLLARGETPCPSVAKAARKKIEHFDKRITQLKKRRALLMEAIHQWEAGSLPDAPFCPLLNVSQTQKMKKRRS